MTIEELKSKTAETSERVAYLAKFLKIADHQALVKDLEAVMAKPDFWDDKLSLIHISEPTRPY